MIHCPWSEWGTCYGDYIDSLLPWSIHIAISLQWCHNERDGVSNHQRLYCLLNCLFRRRSEKTSKLCVTGLCERNPPVTGRFPSQRANSAENVSIWWCHHTHLLMNCHELIIAFCPLNKYSEARKATWICPLSRQVVFDNRGSEHGFLKIEPGLWLNSIALGNFAVWLHDDVIKWKHFPHYWPFVRGIHRSRWIPRTKASDAELWCFLWSAPE